ncbi:MAG: phosphoribosylamine--glycine ligase [Proteobacteria bacterium]|nr:phosphoribosylamine--glycine ligase [Pseudomonadota bacterium]
MKILIIGNGGREHALAWKVAQSPEVTQVFVAPGNAGTALEPKTQNVPIQALDIEKLLQFAEENSIDLTIVGPEAPLSAGIVDAFQKKQLACFGPSAAAAQLEASKSFSKDFMQRYQIPTARYACFEDFTAAKNYINQHSAPLVIKADGLAAGKGVVIAETHEQALDAAKMMLNQPGAKIVVEEFITGEEASFIVITDGVHAIPLATSQDHKTRDDGDKGPNTGGMGAYSPAPIVTPELQKIVMESIIQPTLEGMAKEGHPFVGFLYAGLMITPKGEPKVLEFNCRFGDPETQPILLRMRSDLVKLCEKTLEKSLQTMSIEWDPRPALGVVLASKGYPEQYQKGIPIPGLQQHHLKDGKIFHAGTRLEGNQIVTDGGRVLCITTLGETIADAQAKAYQIIREINADALFYRSDIGHRAVRREILSGQHVK